MLAFNIGEPWRRVIFTNIPFMIVFVIIIIYTSVIVLVPAARFSGYFIVGFTDSGLLIFILAMGLGIGITIYLMQKLVW